MKKYSITLLLMVWLGVTLQAQTTSAPPVNPLLKGKDLLQQLASGLDAGSYLDNWTPWQQSHWYSELTKITDAVSLAKNTEALTEFIRPEKYNEGFDLANLRLLVSGTKNYGDAANILKTLEGGIKPEAYKNDWVAKEPTWISELKFVK